jgi:hypothetical protein
MLSPAQIEARDGKLTASRVACLMTGDEAEIMNLWREMVGDPAFTREDLSQVWPVQLGAFTEPLNLDWFELKHGPISRRGEVVTHENGWAACTLDGWSDLHGCPVECKHTGGREPIETLIARYQPQMHWQMIVTGASRCALSVILGGNEPVVEFLDKDAAYSTELWQRAEAFMQHVWSLTPPVVLAPVTAPIKPEKTYDMTGNNGWASDAVTWITTRQARKDNEAAEKSLKSLVPADAIRCHGHSIEIKRDRANRLSLREIA